MSKETKNKIVPKLRFPEFKAVGEWEEKALEDVAIFLKGKGISKSDISANGVQPCIRYGELYTHYKEIIGSTISFTNIPADDLILSEANDVIIPSSGETREDIATASCVLKGGIALGGDLNIIRSEINGIFLSYYLTHVRKRSIAKLVQGDAVVHLYSSQLQKLKINFPESNDEQEKIADCLSSLDEYLTAQNQKLEALKAHKKGLMQQLFPAERETVPKLRFKEFRDSGEWGEKILKDVCRMQAGKFVSASEISETKGDDLFPCYGGNGLRGYTKSYTHTGKYSLIGRQGALCGNVTLVDGQFHATEHAVVVTPKEKIETTWLFYMLTHLNLNQYATGQAQPGLSVDNLEKVEIKIPKSEKEQQKIGECLSSLDEFITTQAEKVEELKRHKKGLMQGLFPVSTQVDNVSELAKPITTKNKRPEVTTIQLSDEEKRDLLGGYIISKADLKKNFGHIKFVKHMVTAEYYAETEMSTAYHQHNNGPYDKNFMQQWAYRLKQKQWFEEYKVGSSFVYKPLDRAGEIEALFAKVFPEKKETIDYVISVMNRATPDRAEILATVYAVWNDLLLNQMEVNENEIKKYFFKWSEHKKSFDPKRVSDCYKWMLKENFIPKGTGRLIMNLF